MQELFSPVFTRRSVAVVAVFMTLSAALAIYRQRQHAGATESTNTGEIRPAVVIVPLHEPSRQGWKYYFEDSVTRSGRKAYLQWPVDSQFARLPSIYSVLQRSGEITRPPQSDSSLSTTE